MEIVYCGGCGKVLREDEFSRGLARFLDNRPWCSECKPPDKKPISGAIPAQRRTGSSAKHARIASSTHPTIPDDGSKKTMMVGLGIAGVAVLVLLFWVASGSRASAPAPIPEPPVRKVPPPTPPSANAEAERLVKDLEAFASLAPPDKILARCDEIRSKVQGSAFERRLATVEAAARAQKAEAQVSKELDDLRKVIDDDPKFAQFDAVMKRFRAAKDSSPGRAAEIDRRIADYQKARKESPHEKHLGPFEADDQGFIRNWLVIGVFPNDGDRGLDTDFLKDEASHVPVEGLAVGKPKWGAHASAEAKVDFYNVAHLGIKRNRDNVVAYAACLVQVSGDVAAEFRMGTDDGGALWVDGKQVGKVHKARPVKIDEDRYAVPLSPGVHRVLVKVENHSTKFEFILRVVTPDGQRISGLRVWN